MAKPKHFFYQFKNIPPLNPRGGETIRVQVTKHTTPDPFEAPYQRSVYEVYGGNEGLLCNCPSSQYRQPRCKHVEMAEEWLEITEANYGTYIYSTEDEGFQRLDE